MKHLQIGVVLVAGIAFGFATGFYLGADASLPPSPSAIAPTADAHPMSPSSSGVDHGSEPRSTDWEWFDTYHADLKRAVAGQPTPRIVETIGEALRADPPLDIARLLTLIQTMRKEDFPVALRLFKTAKSNINNAFSGYNGPIAWIAFWQQYGAIDPESAFASSRDCGDLNYPGRELLEKHLFTGLARHDAEEAARRFLATPDLANKPFAAEGLIFEWSKKNPAAAVAWAEQHLTNDALTKASYAAVWGASTFLDISGGNALLKVIPPGTMRAGALRSLKSQIANKPNLPASQIFEFMTIARGLQERDPQFEKQQVLRCANLDPMGAANFYAQPSDENQPADYGNLRAVLQTWVQNDRSAAETWAKGQKETPHYDVVVRALNPNDAAK
jgi:hypothetical protein